MEQHFAKRRGWLRFATERELDKWCQSGGFDAAPMSVAGERQQEQRERRERIAAAQAELAWLERAVEEAAYPSALRSARVWLGPSRDDGADSGFVQEF
jgi:hypothetical protein